MRKRRTPPIYAPIVIVVCLFGLYKVSPLVADFGRDVWNRFSPSDTTAISGTTPKDALSALQADKRLINVHEHIQTLDDAERLLKVMDNFGVHKTILVGSSWFTITLNERVGFTRYDENNEELLRVVKAHPDRFEAWPTLDPTDPQKLEKLKSLVERGATGLKLYLGHGFTKRSDGKYMFHVVAMDDPTMEPIYDYCEENFVPICFHVNPGPTTPGFADEFIAVLEHHPDLKVIAPHFILSSIKDSRMQEFLDTFPNLYTDVSFGHDSFLTDGLERISKSPTKFRNLFDKYRTRFMWGTDLVVTEHPSKSVEWMTERFQAYVDMLTKEEYSTPFHTESVKDPETGREIQRPKVLRGAHLDAEILERIFHKNYEDFVKLRPKGTKIKRQIDWSKIGFEPTERAPGQSFPPPKN